MLVNPPVTPAARPALAGGPAAPGASSAQTFDLEHDLARMEDEGGPVAAPRSSRLTSLPVVVHGPGLIQRSAGVAGELLMLVGVVWVLGIAILAIGTPVALVARLFLWMSGSL